ncbi:MAG: 4-hydroxy-tetrahydrodipicolinate reductase [Deltaproteobacteria bacterium]|nr:4-hydroxy-tetrahydrodipicolinate reductase [Deltaproteobacteria bacterium]
MTAIKLAIFGATGRMGQTVTRLAAQSRSVTVVGAIDSATSPNLGRDVGEVAGAGTLGVAVGADVASGLLGADVVIDFSTAGAVDALLRSAAHADVAVVSGTTRLSPESLTLLERAATKVPVLWAPNMSLGVHLLAELVRRAVQALGDYDVEVVEAHHNKKTDAPSGTATFLVQAAERGREGLIPVHGREGDVGARRREEIGVHAVRGGGIVGDHTVHLVGEFDRLELTHRAMSRELFAAGALRAARWIVGRPAGRYELAQVIAGE